MFRFKNKIMVTVILINVDSENKRNKLYMQTEISKPFETWRELAPRNL